MDIQYCCQELHLTLGQVESLLWEVEALRLVVVAELTEGKVHLLEVVRVGLVDALLLDLVDLPEELDEHLLGTLLARLFILCAQLFRLLLENLLELRDAIARNLRIADQSFLHVSQGGLLRVLQQSVEVDGARRHDDRVNLLLEVLNRVRKALLSLRPADIRP